MCKATGNALPSLEFVMKLKQEDYYYYDYSIYPEEEVSSDVGQVEIIEDKDSSVTIGYLQVSASILESNAIKCKADQGGVTNTWKTLHYNSDL